MSTEQDKPLTRAEARALREAAEREAAEREASDAGSPARQSAAEVPLSDALPAVPGPLRGAPRVPDSADDFHPARAAARALGEVPDARAPGAAPSAARPRRGRTTPTLRRPGRFALALGGVVAALALVGGVLAAVGLTQGPRLSSVEADPAEAISLSGSRVILSVNQPLEQVDAAQVTVTPDIPFTVDAAGRTVGVRFTVPLDDATEYTVTVEGVRGIGGGPASDLTTRFTTPASEVLLLQRSSGEDTIWRTGLDGAAMPVFTHERINDFREVDGALVVAVEEGDSSRVLVIEAGEEPRELTLPGDGYVSAVQVSDRGGIVGFVYSDRDLTDDAGRASVLVTQPLRGDAEPSIIRVGEVEASIAEWQFVPDSASVIFIDFSGTLFVADTATGTEPSPMGMVMSIRGVERGTYTAIIQRIDGEVVRMNLADGSEEVLPASDPDYGAPVAIAPYPGGTVQHIVSRDEEGLPLGQAIARVDDAGTATILFEVGVNDTILQACPSPSGQYVAIAVAPDLVNNPFDDMLLALPERMETHLLDLRTGESIVPLSGFNISWCETSPVL